jgi:hypothetical protein
MGKSLSKNQEITVLQCRAAEPQKQIKRQRAKGKSEKPMLTVAARVKLQMFSLRRGSPPTSPSTSHRTIRERNESDSTKFSGLGRFTSLMNGELVSQLLHRRLHVSVRKNPIAGKRILSAIIAPTDL